MAENRDSITSIDLGIEATGVAGNLQAAEAFLSGEDVIVNDPNELEEIKDEVPDPKEKKVEGKVKKAPLKTEEEETKKDIDILEELEDEELTDEKTEEEKEEEAKKSEVKKEESKKDDEEGAGFNEYEALAKDLFKIGVFTPMDDEDVENVKITTPEDLKTRFEKEGQIKATQWLDGFLSRFGDDRKELFEAVFIDGVDLNEYIPIYNEVQSLENVDITKESVQEQIYKEYYKRIGWEDEDIEKRLQKAKDYGDLAEEVEKLHPKIIAQDKERAEDMRKEKADALALQQKIDQEYKISIAKILEEKSKNRDFDGIPLNDKKKTQAFDFLYTKKYKTADGQQLTEFDKFIIDTRRPENHALRVKIALLALDNFDLTKIEKRAVSRESSAIFSELAQKKQKKSGNSQAQTNKVTSWFTQ